MNGSADKANRAGVTLPCYPCDAIPSQAGPHRAWPNCTERSRTVYGHQKTGGVIHALRCRTGLYRTTPNCARPCRANPGMVAFTGGVPCPTLPISASPRPTIPRRAGPCVVARTLAVFLAVPTEP